MADSLVLSGKKSVTKHTGTEMVRLDDKRGGNTWQLPRWWVTGGNGTVYVASTVFKVTAGGASGYLAIASTSESTRVKILHDGSFNFDFQYMNEVSRGALFDADMKVVEHYVFPKISGGKTMVVTPAGAAPRPGGAPTETLTAVALAGADTAVDGETKVYTATRTGDASDVNYVLTSSEGGDSISNLNVTFNGDGDRTLTLTGTSANAQTSKTDTKTVTVSAVAYDVNVDIDSTNGTSAYVLSGDVSGENATINLTAGETLSISNNTGSHPLFLKTAQGIGNGDLVSEGTVTGQGATNGAVTWDTDGVTPGTYYYQCQLHNDMNGEIVVS